MNGVHGPAGRDLLAALRAGRVAGAEARLRTATRLFESTFYQELFKAMRSTVPEGGAIAPGQGQEMFEGLLDQHLAESSAMRSQDGLGEILYRRFAAAAGVDPDAEG